MSATTASQHAAAQHTTTQHSTAAKHTRLTRRGRVFLLTALVAVLFGAFSLGRSVSEAAAPGARPAQHLVTVEQGDSLWELAQRVAPDEDPRDVVAQIRELNDLPGAVLVPGQQLALPVAA